MPRTCRVAAAVLSLSAFAAAGCGADPAPSAPPTTGSAAAAAPAADASPSGGSAFATSTGVTVGLASVGSLGPILVDAQGRALYLYGADNSVHGSCLDQCAKSWPPVTTPGFPLAGPGVDDGLLGAAALADGTAQVLYKGHPLYRYTGDRGPGEATGHTVADPRGTFYAVTSLGDPVGVDISTLRGAGGVPSGVPSGSASGSASAGASAGATDLPTDPAATGATGFPSAPAASTVPAVPSTPVVPYVPPASTTPAVVEPPRGSGTDPAPDPATPAVVEPPRGSG
ncbi:COG4315 family predicted lipoprotein, partial [Kitasatospora griseola]|uniref:COG4315 family predicted lipoprotein n=1 Tax=Kitasatospora griseola TaxID=2064 RepID=UPI003807C925